MSSISVSTVMSQADHWSTQTASPSLLVNDLPADDAGQAYLAHLAHTIQSMSQTTIEDLSQGNTSASSARRLLSPIEEVDEPEPYQGTCTFSPFVATGAALGLLPDTDKFPTLAYLSEFVNTADKSDVDIDMPLAYDGVGLGLLPDTDQFSSLADLQDPATSDDTLEVETSPAFSPVPSSKTGLLPDTDKLPTVADLTISTKKRYPITLSAAGPSTSSSQRYPSALSAGPCRPTQHRRERNMNSPRVFSALLSPVTPSWSPKQCATFLAVKSTSQAAVVI
jgi:hypothetical protein